MMKNENKNNPHDDTLNYKAAKRTALDDISQGYKERGNIIKPETRSDIEILQELYDRDPEALTSTQRMTLGFSHLKEKNEKESLERQKVGRDIMNGMGGDA